MPIPSITPAQIRCMLLLRDEIALLDVRHEAAFATGHPLCAASMAAGRISLEAEIRLPRKDVPVVLYDAGEGFVAPAADRLAALGYTDIRQLEGGLTAWQQAGFELFIDVNSYAKAFGELVESRRHTPSLTANEVAGLMANKADIRILDVRRFDEYATMNIPGSVSVPGAELVLRAGRVAPDPATTIVVNCAGRTRSIIGPVADQCRRRQQGGGAAQRHDGLDTGQPAARAWRRPARRDRPVRGRANQRPRRGLSRRRPACRYRRGRRDAGLSRLGAWPGGAAPPRRYAWFLRDLRRHPTARLPSAPTRDQAIVQRFQQHETFESLREWRTACRPCNQSHGVLAAIGLKHPQPHPNPPLPATGHLPGTQASIP